MKKAKVQNIFYNLSKFWIFVAFLQSLYAWFTWGQLTKSIIILITFLHCAVFLVSAPKFFSIKRANYIPLVLFAFAELYIVIDAGILSFIRAGLQIVIVAFVLFLKDNLKEELLKYFTRAIALILFVSLLAWILFLIGVPLPHFEIRNPDYEYLFDNYYFFLADNKGLVPRFSSIFLEPGHIGIITAFLLYANRFNLKRIEVLVIFIATIFTLSLAAYILTFISAFYFVIIKSKRKIISIIIFISIVLTGVYYFSYLNSDNVVNNLIFARLKYKDGDISGNDRSSYDFNAYFNSFVKTNDVIIGIGNDFLHMDWSKGIAGWKVFIVQYGIIGTLLVFVFYCSLVYYNKSKSSMMFLIVYILCFIQAAYPLWLCELFIFITAMPLLNTNTKYKQNKMKYVKQ